jgi:hypothetical protein
MARKVNREWTSGISDGHLVNSEMERKYAVQVGMGKVCGLSYKYLMSIPK